MTTQTAGPIATDITQVSSSLVDRMDTAIGEASSVMGALMTELIRRSLRGGVLQIGEGLSDYVGERVDATIVEKTPVLETIASDVADRTARSAATEVAKEETELLARTTRESDQQLAAHIEQTAASAQRATSEAARDLSVRIEEAQKHAADVTLETARGLTTQIDEAEKRARETARSELDLRLGELKVKSRETVALLKDRLKALKSMAAELGQRLLDEQQERKTAQSVLKEELQQKSRTLRHELDEANARWREELAELRNANLSLRARVEELEKPRGLRALLRRLMFWRKR